jgi:class 3 adenylate cyclase
MGLAALRMAIAIDVRHVLPVIRVPTLILQRASNPLVPTSSGRFLNEHITNSKYVELPGADFFLFTHEPHISLEEIEEFVTGSRPQIDFDRMLATVLFTDIVRSTELLSEMGDRAWRQLLDRHHAAIRSALSRFGGREIDTAGDGFLATFDGPARAIRCACAARDAVKRLGISIRAGLHTGEVELRGNDVAGLTVHTGARVAALADADEVLVSSTVADLVGGTGIAFEERGTHRLKGVPGEWALLAVTSV